MYKTRTNRSVRQNRKKAAAEHDQYKHNSSSNPEAPFFTGGIEGRVTPSDILTLQRMVGNTAVQNVLQLGKKGDKGSRRTEKKSGKKGQRDKKPGIMSDPQLGDIFIDFWHGFKQKHGGKLADYTGDKLLKKTLRELTGGTSKSENADQTLQWFFSRYLEERHPELYEELLGENNTEEHEDYHQTDPYESKSDEDDEDDASGGRDGIFV